MRNPDSNQRGVAMLEFVLMLPFLWIILVLTFDFGMAFLEKQRTLVAVRELGIRHASSMAAGAAGIDGLVRQLETDTLKPAGMTARFQGLSGTGQCNPSVSGIDGSVVQKSLGLLAPVLGSLSSSHAYGVGAQGKPIVGGLLTQPTYAACFAIDGSPWTYKETGGIGNLLKKLIGGTLGDIGGRMFGP